MTKPKPKEPRRWMTDHALDMIITNGAGRDVLLAAMLLDERRLVDRMNDRIRKLAEENKKLKRPLVMRIKGPDSQ